LFRPASKLAIYSSKKVKVQPYMSTNLRTQEKLSFSNRATPLSINFLTEIQRSTTTSLKDLEQQEKLS
jgi:hypothetical protein